MQELNPETLKLVVEGIIVLLYIVIVVGWYVGLNRVIRFSLKKFLKVESVDLPFPVLVRIPLVVIALFVPVALVWLLGFMVM